MKINVTSFDLNKVGNNSAIILPVLADNWQESKVFKELDRLSKNSLSKKAKQVEFFGGKDETLSIDSEGREIFVLGLGKQKEFNSKLLQKALAAVFKKASLSKIGVASVIIDQLDLITKESLVKLIAETYYLSLYQFDKYKTGDSKKKPALQELTIAFSQKLSPSQMSQLQNDLKTAEIICNGVFLTRDLVNEPPLNQSPEIMVKEAKKIAESSKGKITMKVLEEKECRRLNMGAFLSVAQGADTKPQFIIMHYRGRRPDAVQRTLSGGGLSSARRDKTICLIGKTIIFDSGGLSLKPSRSMETMKMDMAGGATVLGVFKVLSNLSNLDNLSVFGILPACENMPSGRASRPGDIVTTLNGKTVEILNTDAEGRLALADALAYAEKYLKPEIIIDLATLTGAIMVGLGEEITGLFGNDTPLLSELKKAAIDEQEELWEMPLYEGYRQKMKSKMADLQNVSNASYGGAITAAIFLSEFIQNSKWAHLDIAGAAFNEGGQKGIVPHGGTGWGVRTLVRWLLNQN